MTTRHFYLPTRPYNVIQAINRMAAATGSMRYAQLAESADYNGHHVGFYEPNSFKRYWTAVYFWAGNHTIGRGSLTDCLKAAKAEHDRGALGATATLTVDNDEDAAACLAEGYTEGQEPADCPWFTDLHKEVGQAMRYEKTGLVPGAVGMLANSKTLAEYKGKVDAAIAEQRARNIAAGYLVR